MSNHEKFNINSSDNIENDIKIEEVVIKQEFDVQSYENENEYSYKLNEINEGSDEIHALPIELRNQNEKMYDKRDRENCNFDFVPVNAIKIERDDEPQEIMGCNRDENSLGGCFASEKYESDDDEEISREDGSRNITEDQKFVPPMENSEDLHDCGICPVKFKEKEDLTKHVLTHKKEQPHECNICNKKFSRKDNLKTHLRIHEDDSKKTICGKQQENFTRMQTDAGEARYECKICKRIILIHNWKRHLKLHQPNKDGKNFEWENHVRIHADKEQATSVISDLLENPFVRRDLNSKQDIIRLGRPTPIINLTQKVKVGANEWMRHFKATIYEKFKWITACSEQNRFYCWPCLLFVVNEQDKNVWVEEGNDDLSHLTEIGKKHEKTQSHINSEISLKLFDSVKINSGCKVDQLNIVRYNENVRKNRSIFQRLTDAVCFLVKQESVFRGHYNSSNYTDVLKLISSYDELLENHLKSPSDFYGSSKTIQNDIVSSVTNILNLEIKKEVRNAPFVSIMLDKTSDVLHKTKLSVVLRYVGCEGSTVERFLFFRDVDRSSVALFKILQEVITNWDCGLKWVAYCIDGGVVTGEELNNMRKKLKSTFPGTIFIHCSSHALNLVLTQALSEIKACKIFFSTICGIASFFSDPKKIRNEIQRKLPKLETSKWYSSKFFHILKNYAQVLCELFNNVVENPENWDYNTVSVAKGFLNFFEDFSSQFLLNVFAKIFSYTDSLVDLLQNMNYDIFYTIQKVQDVKKSITDMKNSINFDYEYNDIVSLVGEPNCGKKRRLNSDIIDIKPQFNQLYTEILDIILNQIEIRFENIYSLKFFNLLDPNSFQKYQDSFPEACLKSLKETYGKYFDFTKLTNELCVLYRSETLQNMNLSQLIKHIKLHDLTEALSEVNRLAYLILSIPFSIASVDPAFSAQNRLKLYTRNTMDTDKLSNLTQITIEKNLLCDLQSKPDFYDKIINDFSSNCEGSIDLLYK